MVIGLLVTGAVFNQGWPKENRVEIRLPRSREGLERARLSLYDQAGELMLTVLRPLPQPNPPSISEVLRVPEGTYLLTVEFQPTSRTREQIDKNHWGDWTMLGVDNQVQLQGRDYSFPLSGDAQ